MSLCPPSLPFRFSCRWLLGACANQVFGRKAFMLCFWMKYYYSALFLMLASSPENVRADVVTSNEQLEAGSGFAFEKLDSPAINDAGAKATWKLIDGVADRNGAGLEALHDGRVPQGDDEPRANFFFAAGTDGGRLSADLGGITAVNRISTYSRHSGERGPQVYTVYGADGKAAAFDAAPARDKMPETCGWTKIANVDTRPKDGYPGGRHGVSITDSVTSLGNFQYLLFDILPTEKRSQFGLTFFSEIDIVAADGPNLEFVPAGNPPKLVNFKTEDGAYIFQIDATEAADLAEWSEKELAPVVREWYPKIVAMLPSDGYKAATKVRLGYRNDMPAGIPASASGFRINLNAPWFRKQLKGEAKGCVVHEMVHVVQNYWQARAQNPRASQTPGWFVEGLPDYIRWFLYEPETRGALLSPQRLAQAKHDASYRVSANFIDWVSRTYDEDIARKLNASAREGKYSDALWKEHTGKTVDALADEWRSEK